MSEWIESHSNLPRHPKTKRLARLLDVPILPHAVGFIHALWYFALDFAPGGDLAGHEPVDICEACGWEGDPETFMQAFIDARLVDKDRKIHDWEDFNCSHRKRMADAERQRQKRHKDRANANVSQDVTVMGVTVTPDRTGQDRTDRTDRQEEERATAPVDNSQEGDALAAYALQELPPSDSTPDDYLRTIKRYRAKLSDEHIERIIAQLGNWAPTHKHGPKLHLTLASWLNKEPRDAIPPSHVPWVPPPEDPNDPFVEMPDFVKDIAAGIGRNL